MQHKRRRAVLARHGLGGIDRADSRGLQPNTNLGARKRFARLIGHVRHQLKVTAIKHGHGLLHVELELVGANAHDKLATCPARHGRAGVVASTVELKRHRRARLTRIGIANTQHARQRLAIGIVLLVEPRIRHVAQALRAQCGQGIVTRIHILRKLNLDAIGIGMGRSHLGRRRRHQANVHLSLNRRHAQPSRTRLLIPVLGHAHLIPAGRRIPVVRTVRTRRKRIVLLILLGIPTHCIGTGRIVGAPQLNRRAFNRIGQQALVHHARRVGCSLGSHIAITRLEDRLHLLVRDQAVLVGLVDLGIGQLAPVDRNTILTRALHLLAGNIVGAFGIGQLNRALRTYAGRSRVIGSAHHGTRRTGRQHAGDCHNGAHCHIGAVVAELAIQQILKRTRLLHGVTQRVNALPVVLGLLGLGKQARMLKLIALALALHLLHANVHVLPVLAGIVHAVNAGKDADALGRLGKRLAGRLPRIGLKDLSEHLALDLIALE